MGAIRMTPLDGLKLSLKVAIGHNSTILALTPNQLLDTINPKIFTDINEHPDRQKPMDVNYIVDNLQECLNNLLDARKRLINLGLYELDVDYEEKGIPTKQTVQIIAREKIPNSLEEDRDSNSNSETIPPDTNVEI